MLWSFNNPAKLSDRAAHMGRAVLAGKVDAYEAWVQALTDLERELAGPAACEPLGVLAHAWADATRDVTAIQLSAVRWLSGL